MSQEFGAAQELLEERGWTIASLRHVGWMDTSDHSLVELDTDEDYQPPGTVPVFVLGSEVMNPPAIDYLEAGGEG